MMYHKDLPRYLLPLYQTTKIPDWSKLKAFTDDKLKVAKIIISAFDSLENIAGKGENAEYQHFLLFPQCFKKGLCGKELNNLQAILYFFFI